MSAKSEQAGPLVPEEEIGGDRRSSGRDWLIAGGGLLFCLGVTLLRLDRSFGFFVDDAWYVLLAKALATGQGYQLINAPTPGILPLYPPVFPLVLSLVWRIMPEFPANIIWMKLISVLSVLGGGVLTWIRLRWYREVRSLPATWMAMLVVLCLPLSALVTETLMSESFFMLLMMGQIFVMERVIESGRAGANWNRGEKLLVLFGGLLAGMAFLTRSIGIAIIIATVLALLRERLWRQLAIWLVVVLLLAGPWTLYAARHRPTPEQQVELRSNIVIPYSEQFWQRVAGSPVSGTVTVANLPGRILTTLLLVAGQDTLRILLPPVWQWLAGRSNNPGVLKSYLILIISVLLFLLVLIGFTCEAEERLGPAELMVSLTMVMVLLWPFTPQRFLLPLVPFIFYYFWRGVVWVVVRLRPGMASIAERRLATPAIGVLLMVSICGQMSYLFNVFFRPEVARGGWSRAFDSLEQMTEWVSRNIPRDETLAVGNPALISLYTGHRTVGLDLRSEQWEYYRQKRIRYVIFLTYQGRPKPAPLRAYQDIYISSDQKSFRVIDLGPAETRPAFGQ